jgi:hypothetical protein
LQTGANKTVMDIIRFSKEILRPTYYIFSREAINSIKYLSRISQTIS